MAINRNGQATKYKFLHNGKMLKKGFHNSTTLIWSAGSVVTYKVDTGVEYTEEVDSGATCFAPKTFTPKKDGWTFVGWREDSTASGDVLTNKVMDSEPITLYAVFSKVITANFYSGWYPDGRVHNAVTGTAYYNAAGNTKDAVMVTPTGAEMSGWAWRGWSYWYDGSADGPVWQGNGTEFIVHPENDGITFLGLYEQNVTETFYDYDGTKNNTYYTYATTYYNSSGNIKYSDVQSPSAATWDGYEFIGWANDNWYNVHIAPGAMFQSSADWTHYAIYRRLVTVNYFQVSDTTLHSLKDYTYCNVSGNWKHPKFSISPLGFGSEWTWRGWMTEANPHAGIAYENVNDTEITNNVTLYPSIYMAICLSFDGNGATGGSVNSQWAWRMLTTYAGGNIDLPASFVLPDNGFAKTNHSFTGWNKGAVGATIEVWENTTVYAQWQLVPLTLFDNGALRSGDSFHPYSTWNNADNDDTALREASCGNTLYAYGRTSNYDRYSIAGGIFAQAIDLSGFTKLRVTINSASIVSSNNSRWFAGLRNNWFSGGNNAGIPYLDNCVLLSEATGGTFDLDLTAYKNAYGNGAYFLFGAGKVNGNSPNGGAWVHIAKVWLE